MRVLGCRRGRRPRRRRSARLRHPGGHRPRAGRLAPEYRGGVRPRAPGYLETALGGELPLLQWDGGESRFVAMHHPFTAPRWEDLDLLETEPGRVEAQAYDLVLNGTEIGGGSIRIHRGDIQERVFRALSIGPEEAQAKFGFLLRALRSGAPPHGGIALGFDRICAMLVGAGSIRDVIAFPKTTSASDLMCEAPAEVDPRQLRELRIGLMESS